MNIQYITDSTGKTTGVFIPISDWNELKIKYDEINTEEFEIPKWQQNEVKERFQAYKKTKEAQGFEDAMDDIETNL